MIKNVETLRPGDVQFVEGETWEVEAAELQDGMMQVLWRSGEERRWDERAPGTPVIVEAGPAVQKRVRMIKNAAALLPGDQRVGLADPPYLVTRTEQMGSKVVVEWSNGVATRVREYDSSDGVLVEVAVEPL
jgi:hypothetical protein